VIIVLDKQTVIQNFPCHSFRKHQKEVLEEIVEGINSGYKCFLLDCPTGFGKSPLNIALGRSFNKSFYMTPQLTLIDQLKNDRFCGQYLTEIKGKSNYECLKDSNLNCAACLKKIKPQTDCDEDLCPYQIQKRKAFGSQFLLTNFAYFFLVSNGKNFKNRDLMIIDEAHNISEDMVKGMSITISPHNLPLTLYKNRQKQIDQIKEKDDFTEYPELSSLLLEIASDCDTEANLLEITAADLTDEAITTEQREDVRRHLKQSQQLREFSHRIENYLNDSNQEHVFKVDKQGYYGSVYTRITLQPLYASPFMPKKLWNKSEYFILSSATLMDTNLYLKETGLNTCLNEDQVKHITVESTFPKENRPIINATVGKMTFETKAVTLPLAIKRVEEILDMEKGNVAVHCHSYDFAQEIYYKINPRYKNRLIQQEQGKREEGLEQWKNCRDKVFLSVNFEEGQDWVGDICTAQILFKVPYLNLNDKRVRVRINGRHENDWFNNETLKKVIQSYGRAVRTETDQARFYVIDESFLWLLQKSDSIPPFFIEAPLIDWSDWQEIKYNEPTKIILPPKDQNCGYCQNFETKCSHADQAIFKAITPNQWAVNVGMVGRYCSLASNCQNWIMR
jgi:Rad3-related DNA helicase